MVRIPVSGVLGDDIRRLKNEGVRGDGDSDGGAGDVEPGDATLGPLGGFLNILDIGPERASGVARGVEAASGKNEDVAGADSVERLPWEATVRSGRSRENLDLARGLSSILAKPSWKSEECANS